VAVVVAHIVVLKPLGFLVEVGVVAVLDLLLHMLVGQAQLVRDMRVDQGWHTLIVLLLAAVAAVALVAAVVRPIPVLAAQVELE
jgi:hypothetical protein